MRHSGGEAAMLLRKLDVHDCDKPFARLGQRGIHLDFDLTHELHRLSVAKRPVSEVIDLDRAMRQRESDTVLKAELRFGSGPRQPGQQERDAF